MSKQDDVATSVERADPFVGTIFDKRFKVEERIAAGGFGAIYRATHIKSGHRIALKVLLPSLAQDLGVVARFRREGDALTTLRHPHTITAYELGQAADRTLFIVMELLHGESLFERYKANGPLEWRRMAKIAREVCESLAEAHALGIVHRDLKPTNIHLEQRGDDRDYVKVLDFGIAKILGSGAADLTNAGQMIGTIDYMSPEQMVGANVTGQTDIYTLGIVMYEMIAGCMPFGESLTAAQALAAVMKTKPQRLCARVSVPEELDRIVMRCLERDTSRRYATVDNVRADLDRLLGNHDEEATQFTPPPEPLLRRSKRPSVEDTTFTPPPERLLAASRPPAWGNEATAAGIPSAQLLALARGAKADFEATQLTPPPAQLIAASAGAEWTDDDEQFPTSKSRRITSEENERVTAVARLADIVERAAMTRGPESERAVTVPRGDSSERAVTVPRGPRDSDADLATARFDRKVLAELRARQPSSAPPPAPPAALQPPPLAPPPALQPPPIAQSSPVVQPPLTPVPLSRVAPATLRALTPPTALPPPPVARFDVTNPRQVLIRRLLWTAAIVVALGIGAILAIQL